MLTEGVFHRLDSQGHRYRGSCIFGRALYSRGDFFTVLEDSPLLLVEYG